MRALRAGWSSALLCVLALSAIGVAEAYQANVPGVRRIAPRRAGLRAVPLLGARGRWMSRQPSLAHSVALADIVCLAELVSANPAAGVGMNRAVAINGRLVIVPRGGGFLQELVATYNIVRVAKTPEDLVHPLDDIESHFTTAEKGDLCLILGYFDPGGRKPRYVPIPISEDAFDYAIEAPPPDQSTEKRARYFNRFLLSPDEQIADDALGEFGRLSYEQLVELKALFSDDVKAECRRALGDASLPMIRRIAWGRLIAAFGTAQDARLLEPFCFGPNGVAEKSLGSFATAYLQLAGESGVDKFDRAFRNRENLSDADATSLLSALVAFGDQSFESIPKDRLARSVRMFVDRPGQFSGASATLARWEHRTVEQQFAHFVGHLDAPNKQIAALALAEISHYPVTELPKDVPRERFLKLIRSFLDRADQTQTAITVLSLWEHWTARDRLTQFLAFLNSPNQHLVSAAHNELNRCSHRALADIRDVLPKEAIEAMRRRFSDPETSPFNRASAARILGTCGTPADLPPLEAALTGPRPQLRYVTTEMAIGYLLLSNKQGFDRIDEWLIKDPNATAQDAHAALEAITTVYREFPERTDKARALHSVHLLLDQPGLAWRALRFLIEERDWSIHDRLMALYADPETLPLTKWEVVRYLLTAERARPRGRQGQEIHDSVTRSLAALRKQDPKVVADVENTVRRMQPHDD